MNLLKLIHVTCTIHYATTITVIFRIIDKARQPNIKLVQLFAQLLPLFIGVMP